MVSSRPGSNAILIALADKELKTVRTMLKRRAKYPAATPVTFLLFQPVSNTGARLVDIGLRPEGADPDALVYQQAFTGQSGSFLGDPDAPFRTVPRPNKITARDVSSYNDNPLSARKAQVELERQRYSGAVPRWKSKSSLPVNAEIQHLGLMPWRIDLAAGADRYPNLGMVYTLTRRESTEDKAREIQRKRLSCSLIFYSLAAGDTALEARLRTLLGTSRFELFSKPQTLSFPELAWAVGSVMLTHHWYYASDPVAAETLSKSITHSQRKSKCPENLESLFANHSGEGPLMPIDVEQHRSLSEVLSQTSEDVLQLSRYAALYDGNRDPEAGLERDAVRRAAATMVMLFAGELIGLQNRFVIPIHNQRDLDNLDESNYITVGATWLCNEPVRLPAWKKSELKALTRAVGVQESKNRYFAKACRDAPKALAAGEIRFPKHNAHTQPAAFVTQLQIRGGECEATMEFPRAPREGEPLGDWLLDYVRYRIFVLLEEIKHTPRPETSNDRLAADSTGKEETK